MYLIKTLIVLKKNLKSRFKSIKYTETVTQFLKKFLTVPECFCFDHPVWNVGS